MRNGGGNNWRGGGFGQGGHSGGQGGYSQGHGHEQGQGFKRKGSDFNGAPQNKFIRLDNQPQRSIRLGDDEDDPLGSSLISKSELPHPQILADERVGSLPIFNPGKLNIQAFNPLKNSILSSTWVGKKCGICKDDAQNHQIDDNKAVLVGDQFLPPVIGGLGDCVPVGRIDSATFAHVKLFLQAQKESGFCPQPGTILIVSLTSFACAVGSDTYWREFDDFCKWAYKEFRVQTMPCLVPFPNGLSDTYLSRLHQTMTAARARYLGDFVGGVDWRYALWEPLTDFLSKSGAKKEKVASAPVVLENKGRVIVECPANVWAGMPGDFSVTPPPEIEKVFFKKALQKVESVSPNKIGFKCPSEEALKAGYELKPPPTKSDQPNRPTIHLYGTSIMKDAVESIMHCAERGNYNVQNHCREDSNDISVITKEKNIPARKHQDDCVVLLFLGNEHIKKDNFKKFHSVFHYTNPKILEDKGVNAMIDLTSAVISNIKKKFDGRIFCIGPLPRLVEQCCKVPTHHFELGPLFKTPMQYTFMLNKFLQVHPLFNDQKAFFVAYDVIFGVNFSSKDLSDGVHLSPDANATFAEFIAELPSYTPKKVKSIKNPKPSFYTWAENIQESAKAIKALRKTPLTSTPRTTKRTRGRLTGAGEQAVSPIAEDGADAPTGADAPEMDDVEQPPAVDANDAGSQVGEAGGSGTSDPGAVSGGDGGGGTEDLPDYETPDDDEEEEGEDSDGVEESVEDACRAINQTLSLHPDILDPKESES